MKRLHTIALLSLTTLALPATTVAQDGGYLAPAPVEGAPMMGNHHPGQWQWGYGYHPMAMTPNSHYPGAAAIPDPMFNMPLPPPSTAYSVEEYRMLLDRRAETLRKQFEQQQQRLEQQQRQQMERLQESFSAMKEWSEQYYAETRAAIDLLRNEHRQLIEEYQAEERAAMEKAIATMKNNAATTSEPPAPPAPQPEAEAKTDTNGETTAEAAAPTE